MILIETNDIPKKKRRPSWHNMREIFEGFVDMHVKITKVVIDYAGDEYQNFNSAYESFRFASKKYSEYPVKIVGRGADIYLVRTDML